MMNIINYNRIFLFFLLLLFFNDKTSSLQILVYPFKHPIAKSSLTIDGIMIHITPGKVAEKYRIYLTSDLKNPIATLRPITDIKEAKKILPDNDFQTLTGLFKVKDSATLKATVLAIPSPLSVFSFHNDDISRLLGNKYIDPAPPEKGKTKKYLVRTYLKGKLIEQQKSSRVKWGVVPKIPIPKNLKGEAQNKGATLKFKRISNPEIIGYNVYKSKTHDKNHEKVNKGVINVFPDPKTKKVPKLIRYDVKNLVNDETYYFRVAALHRNKMESILSPPLKLIPKENTRLVPPEIDPIPANTIESNVAKITWRPINSKDLASYNLYRTIDDHNGKYAANQSNSYPSQRYKL